LHRARRFIGSTLIALAIAISLLSLRSVTGALAQEGAAEDAASRQAARARGDLRVIERRAQTAAQLRELNAAVASHVDSATILDLLDSEDWWRPYREEFPFVRLIVGDELVAARGAPGRVSVEAALVKDARREVVASAEATVATQPYLVAAARLTAIDDGDPVLILGRPAAPPAAAPDIAVPQAPAGALPIPWAATGAIGLAGVGLLVSGRRKPPASRQTAATIAYAPAAPDDAVIPISHETTLRFGEARGDGGPAVATAAAAAVVVVEAAPEVPAPFGRYRLVERFSEGGMSELFIAEAAGVEGFTRSFVLKRLRPELARDKAAVAQFIDEARLQADLVHSNIVPVYDFGVVAGEYFMTQEHIVGRDIGRLLERLAARGQRSLPTPVAYYVAHETLQALAYAHARRDAAGAPLGIVHRDVAAGNVIVSLAGEVKLTDFGIVKSNDRVSRTQIGVVKGNTSFMSPEQARGQTVDARSDLFSLGLLLYYCLAGELLYAGFNNLEVLHHAAAGLLADDLDRIGRLPDPAPQILARALAVDASLRFQTASEFADELAVHMGGGRVVLARLMRELFGAERGPEIR
jgi:serine/threonine-protein kinase